MNIGNVTSTLKVLQDWFSRAVKLGQVVGENSYSDLTKETKVEPWVIISKDCLGVEAMPDIMQGVLSYTIADYAQAVALFGKIDDIKVRRALGTFNPNRDGSGAALLANLNLENRDPLADKFCLPISSVPTLEASNGSPPQGRSSGISSKDVLDEARNMSVGKLVDIPFQTGVGSDGRPCTVTLPIQFRLLASYIASPSMLNILAVGRDDTSFTSRFERARDGGISTAMDFLLAQDMIEAQRKVLYSDDGKVLQQILSRKEASKRAALAARSPSLATLSNIFIISESEAKDLEQRMGRNLDSSAAREQIFRNVAASTLIIVDRGWSNVTFYHRGYDRPTVMDFKQLKSQSSGKGPDLMDMFRQFNLGMPVA